MILSNKDPSIVNMIFQFLELGIKKQKQESEREQLIDVEEDAAILEQQKPEKKEEIDLFNDPLLPAEDDRRDDRRDYSRDKVNKLDDQLDLKDDIRDAHNTGIRIQQQRKILDEIRSFQYSNTSKLEKTKEILTLLNQFSGSMKDDIVASFEEIKEDKIEEFELDRIELTDEVVL